MIANRKGNTELRHGTEIDARREGARETGRLLRRSERKARGMTGRRSRFELAEDIGIGLIAARRPCPRAGIGAVELRHAREVELALEGAFRRTSASDLPTSGQA